MNEFAVGSVHDEFIVVQLRAAVSFSLSAWVTIRREEKRCCHVTVCVNVNEVNTPPLTVKMPMLPLSLCNRHLVARRRH